MTVGRRKHRGNELPREAPAGRRPAGLSASVLAYLTLKYVRAIEFLKKSSCRERSQATFRGDAFGTLHLKFLGACFSLRVSIPAVRTKLEVSSRSRSSTPIPYSTCDACPCCAGWPEDRWRCQHRQIAVFRIMCNWRMMTLQDCSPAKNLGRRPVPPGELHPVWQRCTRRAARIAVDTLGRSVAHDEDVAAGPPS